MPQYRDLHQCKTRKKPVSKKMQELIDKEKARYNKGS